MYKPGAAVIAHHNDRKETVLENNKYALLDLNRLGKLSQQEAVEKHPVNDQRLFSQPHQIGPALRFDLFETEDQLHLLCDLPGIKPENLKVSLNQQVIRIMCEFSNPTNHTNVIQTHYAERQHGSRERVILLPAGVDVENVCCRLENGVLDVRLPKAQMHPLVDVDVEYRQIYFK